MNVRFICVFGFTLMASIGFAQAVFPVPYSSQLKTDPAVGNIQGIQRFGRPLKTDPDQGEGFSYHVYPVMPQNAVAAVTSTGLSEVGATADGGQDFTKAQQEYADESRTHSFSLELANLQKRLLSESDETEIAWIRNRIQQLQRYLAGSPFTAPIAQPKIDTPTPEPGDRDAGERMVQGVAPTGSIAMATVPGPSVAAVGAFDWTAGIRSNTTPYFSPQMLPGVAPSLDFGPMTFKATVPFGFGSPQAEAISITRSQLGYTQPSIFHQPLIQIKLRVVEVARANGTFSNSVLEYVSRANTDPSLTSGTPLNSGFENLRGLTRFVNPGLISNASTGAGLLFNLTSEHINWVVSLLATELNADVVTAPEVVTLNGQNVEFLAGEKVAFELGQNVIQGTNNNIQQLFYKHVGTMVSVTPRIVNWGLYGEGDGEAPLTSQDIAEWNLLVDWMIHYMGITSVDVPKGNGFESQPLNAYVGPESKPVPLSIRGLLLLKLGDYSRRELIERGFPMHEICTEDACRWSPENCTIDVSLVVRLSDANNANINPDADPSVSGSTRESNVRAVANVVQLKSGHGVVMAGLIGERENEESTKIPVLGDIPYVGALFRSRAKSRIKTEVLIFVEARVLDSQPHVARYQSAEDFYLSRPFVRGSVLDNPLECCLRRYGIASYACDCCEDEVDFWRLHGRDVRQAARHFSDIFK